MGREIENENHFFMTTEYNVDYFIKKFEAIPEAFWITGELYCGHRSCANGHCGVRDVKSIPEEASALQRVFSSLSLTYASWCPTTAGAAVVDGSGFFPIDYSIKAAAVNNGECNEYRQPTPKERILAALYDIKKAQQPEVKERIVYVMVDQPVKDLVKADMKEN